MAGEINWGLLDTRAPERAANSFYEGQRQQQQTALAQAQLQGAQRQNKLADLAMQDDQATRSAYQSSGGDMTKALTALQQGGQYKAAGELQSKMSAQQKEALAAKKLELENHAKKFEVIGQIMGGVTDQASYDAARQQMAQIIGPEAANQAPPAYNPQFIEQQRTKAMTVKDQLANQWKSIGAQLDQDKFAETKANNLRVDARTVRGQNMLNNQIHKSNTARQGGNPDGLLDPDTLKVLGEQYLAGDTSVFTNLGRGAQGGQNVVALRREIAKQNREAGGAGSDLAAKNAEYFGVKAGQRTAGTRMANVELASEEASQLIPLARTASSEVARSGLLPFGKAQIMFDNQTNDPKLRQFAAANNSLINVYARAISPSGVPTVADKEHAREMLATAMDDKSYNAVLDQMELEMKAARSAPKTVRKAFSDAVSGREAKPPAGAPAKVTNDAEYSALPSGAVFVGPDGKTRRKP